MHTNFLFLIAISMCFMACDPDGKQECAWILEPEPETKTIPVHQGFVPLCARNRITNKQDCRLQAHIEFAKEVFERKFRYTDMQVLSPALPRTLVAVRFCDGKNPAVLKDIKGKDE